MECKSYSKGVHFPFKKPGKYKLFDDSRRTVLDVVKGAVGRELVERGLCPREPHVTLSLAAAYVASDADRERLHAKFKQEGWRLFDDRWVRQRVRELADQDYEDDLAVLVAKLMAS